MTVAMRKGIIEKVLCPRRRAGYCDVLLILVLDVVLGEVSMPSASGGIATAFCSS